MKKLLFAVFSLMLLSSALGQQGQQVVVNSVETGPKHHADRVIVRFRGNPQFLEGSGPGRALAPGLNMFAVQNPPGLSVAQTLARYKNNPNVIYAEPDYFVQVVDTTPGDPMWSSQWDMVKIAAPAAWDTQKYADDVVVAVVDTGIAYGHPDLAGNLWTDTSGACTGTAGAHGFTCMGGSCVVNGLDDHGHGTHVAGTIGAVGGNGVGIAGINWSVKLLSMKFLDQWGSGNISDAVLAFEKIRDLRNAGVNIRVTNNSWGGGSYTQALKDIMAQVEAAGILDVCAAGNAAANADASPMYPGAYDNPAIISVAASDSSDAGASFSNVGLATVDIAAPGVNTLSTAQTGTCSLCDSTGYRLLNGTSMASPHVAGVAAALFKKSPGATPTRVRDVILSPASYDALPDVRLRVTSTSGGRLNFQKALNNPLLTSGGPLNIYPVISPLSDTTANAGQLIQLNATASDANNDPVTLGWSSQLSGSAIYSAMLNNIFPTPPLNTSPFSFTAASLARTAFAKYTASVADGRGGSAMSPSNVLIAPSPGHGQPTGNFSLSTNSIPSGGTVRLNFNNLVDPDGQSPVYWQAWFLSSTVWGEMCCLSSSSSYFDLQLSYSGAYRISVQAINKALNLSTKYTQVISVGGVTGIPPIASVLVDKLEGAAPLTVNFDMSTTAPGGSPIWNYYFYCPDGLKSQGNPSANCTFTEPGTYYVWTSVKDTAGLMDAAKTYITVLPSTGPPPPPPAPDFSIGASPSSRTVTAGNNTSYSVSVSALNGFSGPVGLSVSGLPSGANGGFNPSSVTGSGSSTLTVTTSSSTPAGTYPLTITGTSGSLVHTTSVNLVVNAPPPPPPPTGDFSISASTSSITIPKGGSALVGVTVTPSGGFNSTVTFSTSGLPNGGTGKFNPTSVVGSGSSNLTINTSKGTKLGTYTLTITGSSSIGTRTTTVSLKVQ